jgi:tetratricopeptide (TPR) repeat protein
MKEIIFSIALVGVLSTLSADVISQKGIAKDSVTGLIWQDDNDVKTILKDWYGAKAYCKNLTLGGFSDWRLPNIYELTTLLDNTKLSKPYVIDGIENINLYSSVSSTTDGKNAYHAWRVYFNHGSANLDGKTNNTYVRCVRIGQLNFDNLMILKNKGKLKVSQKNINKILEREEINTKTLQKYNDTAYYLQQANANNEAIFLLEKIIEKFPNRTVAYLNLADAYDGIYNKEKAKENYERYINLMKQDNKENKIPKRVLEYK